MPNLDPWIKQLNSNNNEEESIILSKFENHLLSIKTERQRMIHPNHTLPIMNVIKKL